MNDSAIREFFAAYEAVSNALDVGVLETFFADACVGAAPGGVAAISDRASLHAAVVNLVDFYRTVGRGAVRVIDVSTHTLGAYHTLATVQWTASFPTVAAPIPFEVSYLLQYRDALQPIHGGLRIVAFVSHEDEAAVMREHGILPQ